MPESNVHRAAATSCSTSAINPTPPSLVRDLDREERCEEEHIETSALRCYTSFYLFFIVILYIIYWSHGWIQRVTMVLTAIWVVILSLAASVVIFRVKWCNCETWIKTNLNKHRLKIMTSGPGSCTDVSPSPYRLNSPHSTLNIDCSKHRQTIIMRTKNRRTPNFRFPFGSLLPVLRSSFVLSPSHPTSSAHRIDRHFCICHY